MERNDKEERGKKIEHPVEFATPMLALAFSTSTSSVICRDSYFVCTLYTPLLQTKAEG